MDFNQLLQDFFKMLNHLKQSLFEFLPKLLGAAFVVLIGFVIAWVVRGVVIRLINKIHRLIPNQRIRNKVRIFIEEKPISKIIGSILYWILIFFFVTVATETLGLPVVTTWLSGIVGYLPKILSATLIGIAGVIAGVILRDLITTAATSAGLMYGSALGKLVQVVVLLVTMLIGIDQIGIDVTLLESVLVIAIGALLFGAALAFGVGAKTSVSNILASYYLQKIYKVGDTVRIGNKEGRIVEITSLAVILDSAEGRICVPAQEFNEESSTLLSKESSS